MEAESEAVTMLTAGVAAALSSSQLPFCVLTQFLFAAAFRLSPWRLRARL
jgi:hypothetical protein